MGKLDNATPQREAIFAAQEAQALSAASGWDRNMLACLQEVVGALKTMTAWYSYGNGNINIDRSLVRWVRCDEYELVERLNSIVVPYLEINLSREIIQNDPSSFSMWFEMIGLYDELNDEAEPDDIL